MSTLTAANAIITLAIASLFPAPQQLQGFSADDVFDTDPLQSAETSMGVDGVLSGGFVFVPVVQGITLQADSDSNNLFEAWWGFQQVNKDIFRATGVVILPAVGKKFALTRGILTTYPSMPNAGKILKPRKYAITWESVTPAVS